MTELERKLLGNASAFAVMAALEFGYKACEAGMNLQAARAALIEVITTEKKS